MGQTGVHLIEGVVLSMRSRWTPGGPNEVGIDGYIELCEPASGRALNLTLAVQSKAVTRFANETAESFDYWCSRSDIDYWLSGNTPVLLILSKPELKEAFWISIKDYFSDPARASSTRVTFNKRTDRFDKDAFDQLVKLGTPKRGLYLAPVPRSEKLQSNLIPLEMAPPRIYMAGTEFRSRPDVWSALKKHGNEVHGNFDLWEKKIAAFHDLSSDPWRDVCDLGTLESFDTTEWSDSDDPDRQRLFVRLLNHALRDQLYPDVRFWPNEGCFAFVGSIEQAPRYVGYRALKKNSRISAVSVFSQTIKDGRKFTWLRHLAFKWQFRRLADQWYLELTPTYRFTSDGNQLERFHEDRLKGIKRMEGNRAVLSALMCWADWLRPKQTLLGSSDGILTFGRQATFDCAVGIHDAHWLSNNPKDRKKSDEPAPGYLFGDPDEETT